MAPAIESIWLSGTAETYAYYGTAFLVPALRIRGRR